MAVTLTHVPTAEVQAISMVLGYQSSRASSTVVHTIIGRPNPDFTVKPVGPRTGTYRFFCTTATTASAVAAFLARNGPFTLTDSATTMANTTFLVTGDIGFELDAQTLRRCIVTAVYTEAAL